MFFVVFIKIFILYQTGVCVYIFNTFPYLATSKYVDFFLKQQKNEQIAHFLLCHYDKNHWSSLCALENKV